MRLTGFGGKGRPIASPPLQAGSIGELQDPEPTMYRPGVDERNVQMSDVLCDFCHRRWTEEMPFIEGHRGAMICGNCLSLACAEVVNTGEGTAPPDYFCTMCREKDADREALNRAGEPGWRSPMHEEAAICRRCIKLAAGALEKDPDFDWTRPGRSG